MAKELDANYFDIPDAKWNAMTTAEKWAANQKFLDDAIARGDTFRLTRPFDKANSPSTFQKEVQYLMQRGYTASSDKMQLLPPGGK